MNDISQAERDVIRQQNEVLERLFRGSVFPDAAIGPSTAIGTANAAQNPISANPLIAERINNELSHLRDCLHSACAARDMEIARNTKLQNENKALEEKLRVIAGQRAMEAMKRDEEEISAMNMSVPTVEPGLSKEDEDRRRKKMQESQRRTIDGMRALGIWKW